MFVARDTCSFKKLSFRKMSDFLAEDLGRTLGVDERFDALDILSYYELGNLYDSEILFAIDNSIPYIGQIVQHRIGGENQFACSVDRLEYDKGVPVLTVRHLTSSKDRGRVEHELSCRLDVLGQLWAVSCKLKVPVLDVRYEVIRTKSPAVPKTTICKACSGAGLIDDDTDEWPKCEKCSGTGVGGMSTAKCDTVVNVWKSELDNHEHLDRDSIIEANKGLLDALHERGDVFVYELHKKFKKEQLTQWRYWMQAIIGEVDLCVISKSWPCNVYACSRNGVICPYSKVCSGNAGEEAGVFHRVEEDFPGLYDSADLWSVLGEDRNENETNDEST